MVTISPMLWLDNNAEEAAAFYVSLFDDASITDIARGPEGAVLTVSLSLNGQKVSLLNGGPMFPQSEAFSFVIDCADQAEVDYFWNAITADGGQESNCSWCKDKFGVSWQAIPRRLMELLSDPDPQRAAAAMQAMLTMNKIIVADLEAAVDAVPV